MGDVIRRGQLDRSRPVALQVHEILRERILKVELVPGTILSRASLQLEFGVSQTPVRDSLMRLQEEGLVEVYPQYATVVAKIDVDHARQAQFLRLSIELEAVRRLTGSAPMETADELREILSRQRAVASPETYDKFDAVDREFHRRLYEKAGIAQLWANVRRQSVWGSEFSSRGLAQASFGNTIDYRCDQRRISRIYRGSSVSELVPSQ
jgi:DNA-binding GntR family transcriptional regulator